MAKHKKIYFDYFEYCPDDVILCEKCGSVATDIHHLKYKSRGGKDEIENLMALCRECHNEEYKENYLREIHLKNL